jgi:hypothetical protein
MDNLDKLGNGLASAKDSAESMEKVEVKKRLDLKSIIQLVYPANRSFSKKYKKTQTVGHHTVSGKGVMGDLAHWLKAKFNMGTPVIFPREGPINQLFSTSRWAYHLGVQSWVYKKLGIPYNRRDMESIGYEIDSYGGLKWNKSKERWENVYGGHVATEDVIEYPKGFRGYYAFERYTPNQVELVRQFLVYCNEVYGIPMDYKPEMWEVSAAALSGEAGNWSHTSFRYDKSDMHPQPELIEMFKGLA